MNNAKNTYNQEIGTRDDKRSVKKATEKDPLQVGAQYLAYMAFTAHLLAVGLITKDEAAKMDSYTKLRYGKP